MFNFGILTTHIPYIILFAVYLYGISESYASSIPGFAADKVQPPASCPHEIKLPGTHTWPPTFEDEVYQTNGSSLKTCEDLHPGREPDILNCIYIISLTLSPANLICSPRGPPVL